MPIRNLFKDRSYRSYLSFKLTGTERGGPPAAIYRLHGYCQHYLYLLVTASTCRSRAADRR